MDTVAHPITVRLKEIKKRRALIGKRTVVQVTNILQVQKNANYFAANNLSFCSHFFAGTVVLSIPSFFTSLIPSSSGREKTT